MKTKWLVYVKMVLPSVKETPPLNIQTNTEQSDNADSGMEVDFDANTAASRPVQACAQIIIPSFGPEYIGKDAHTPLYVHQPSNRKGKTRKQNIVTKFPGVKGERRV